MDTAGYQTGGREDTLVEQDPGQRGLRPR